MYVCWLGMGHPNKGVYPHSGWSHQHCFIREVPGSRATGKFKVFLKNKPCHLYWWINVFQFIITLGLFVVFFCCCFISFLKHHNWGIKISFFDTEIIFSLTWNLFFGIGLRRQWEDFKLICVCICRWYLEAMIVQSDCGIWLLAARKQHWPITKRVCEQWFWIQHS